MDVSIIVPCYNGERFVQETLASALAQEGDLEVIVVDDGSTDTSATIVQSMAERDQRVKLRREPNRGSRTPATSAFERSLRPAASCSSWMPMTCSPRMPCTSSGAASNASRPSARCSGHARGLIRPAPSIEPAPASIPAYFADERGVRELDMGDRIGYWHILPINPISTPGQCLIRVSDLAPGDVFDQRYAPCEDWEMWLRLARRRPIGVEHHEVLSYRDHQSSASKMYSVMYEQRAAVYQAQLEIVTPEERPRLRAAWRFGMFRFDARLCLRWARARFKERDLLGSGRYLLRSLRCEANYLWAVVRNEPDVDVVLARSH